MRPEKVRPNALAGASGACDCASGWRHGSEYSIFTSELHRDLRAARLGVNPFHRKGGGP